MEISKKELIVTLCFNIILLLIVIASIIVLNASVLSLVLGDIAIVFIFISSIISWTCLNHDKDDKKK